MGGHERNGRKKRYEGREKKKGGESRIQRNTYKEKGRRVRKGELELKEREKSELSKGEEQGRM